MKLPIVKKENMTPNEFFGKLFQIRNQIHLTHLKVTGVGSYASHKALNKFYDSILDLTDSLIESYQGKYGIIDITVPEAKAGEPISIIQSLASLVDGGSVWSTFQDSWSRNQLDEISTLCYSTLYKLKNLK